MNPFSRLIALMRDPRTPKLPRVLMVAALIYTLSPVDLVPEAIFTPLVGLLDDATLLWVSWRWLFKSGPAPETPPPPYVSGPPARQ